jgi:16S rRNA (guanine1207-N2)-methyltransferase
MMADQQYFAPSPLSPSEPKPFTLNYLGRDFRFFTDSGVFSKGELDFGSKTLLSALPQDLKCSVLDLGCGWGAVGVIIGALHPQAAVTLADINARAVQLARLNARENKVPAQVGQSDGFAQIRGSFDCIAFNPPIRAGKETVYRLLGECAQHLRPGGALYVVMRKQQGAQSAAVFLKGIFPVVETVKRKGGYHVMKCSGGLAHGV